MFVQLLENYSLFAISAHHPVMLHQLRNHKSSNVEHLSHEMIRSSNDWNWAGISFVTVRLSRELCSELNTEICEGNCFLNSTVHWEDCLGCRMSRSNRQLVYIHYARYSIKMAHFDLQIRSPDDFLWDNLTFAMSSCAQTSWIRCDWMCHTMKELQTEFQVLKWWKGLFCHPW